MAYEDGHLHAAKPIYECLLFDVDDTLYPLSSGLSHACTENINEYMISKLGIEEEKVPELCVQLYKDYGTTMAGLRALGYEFDYDDFHGCVHGRLPYETLKPDPVLKGLLQSLPYRKVIFSNANEEHVDRILGRLGLEGCFERIICFETLNPIKSSPLDGDDAVESKSSSSVETEANVADEPCETDSAQPKSPVVCKPFEDAFEEAFKIAEIDPKRTLFFDDSIRNIQTGKQLGLHTVWVGHSQRTQGVDYALESIHNIREALPELWEDTGKNEVFSGEVGIETIVRA